MSVAPQAAAAPRSWMRDPRRWAWAGAGLGSVSLGWLGVFVPGLPTTVFLLIASYCFARSCPWLEDRLLRVSVFAPYMKAHRRGPRLVTPGGDPRDCVIVDVARRQPDRVVGGRLATLLARRDAGRRRHRRLGDDHLLLSSVVSQFGLTVA